MDLKRNTKAALAALILSGLLSTQLAQSSERAALVVGAGEWKPLVSISLPENGMLAQIVTEAFLQVGQPISYAFFPWARTEQLALEGELAGAIGYIKTQRRLARFHYSKLPIYKTKQALFHFKGRPISWQVLSDLSDYLIGVTTGYSYGEEFEKAVALDELQLISVNSDEQAMKMLAAGRIDMFAVEINVGNSIAGRMSLKEGEQLVANEHLIDETPLYFIVSQQMVHGEAIMESFNTGFRKLMDSGRYHEILQEHLAQ